MKETLLETATILASCWFDSNDRSGRIQLTEFGQKVAIVIFTDRICRTQGTDIQIAKSFYSKRN